MGVGLLDAMVLALGVYSPDDDLVLPNSPFSSVLSTHLVGVTTALQARSVSGLGSGLSAVVDCNAISCVNAFIIGGCRNPAPPVCTRDYPDCMATAAASSACKVATYCAQPSAASCVSQWVQVGCSCSFPVGGAAACFPYRACAVWAVVNNQCPASTVYPASMASQVQKVCLVRKCPDSRAIEYVVLTTVSSDNDVLCGSSTPGKWASVAGGCRLRTCPMYDLYSNGALLSMDETPSGRTQTKPCPSVSNGSYYMAGSVTMTCPSGASDWSSVSGACTLCALSCVGGSLVASTCTCKCFDGYSGPTCDSCTRMCTPNQGTLDAASCSCSCETGFRGKRCEISVVPIAPAALGFPMFYLLMFLWRNLGELAVPTVFLVALFLSKIYQELNLTR